jgi:hypothetical protein
MDSAEGKDLFRINRFWAEFYWTKIFCILGTLGRIMEASGEVILDGYLFVEMKAQNHSKASDRNKFPAITNNENRIH